MGKRVQWLSAAVFIPVVFGCSAEPADPAPGPEALQPVYDVPSQPVAGQNGQPPVQPVDMNTQAPPMMMPVPMEPLPMEPASMPMEPVVTDPDPMEPDPMEPDPMEPDPMEPIDPGDSVSGIDPDELEMLRQACVDEINMYRATISLPPIERASADRELCSDQGAQKDADNNAPHSSSGRGNPCSTGGGWNAFPNFQAQNTCPGWPVGGFGAATIVDAMRGCLKGMWEEGIPPQGIEQCKQEYFMMMPECFLAHGHYINMQDDYKAVSCGFYRMSNGRYWMNQDFL